MLRQKQSIRVYIKCLGKYQRHIAKLMQFKEPIRIRVKEFKDAFKSVFEYSHVTWQSCRKCCLTLVYENIIAQQVQHNNFVQKKTYLLRAELCSKAGSQWSIWLVVLSLLIGNANHFGLQREKLLSLPL